MGIITLYNNTLMYVRGEKGTLATTILRQGPIPQQAFSAGSVQFLENPYDPTNMLLY